MAPTHKHAGMERWGGWSTDLQLVSCLDHRAAHDGTPCGSHISLPRGIAQLFLGAHSHARHLHFLSHLAALGGVPRRELLRQRHRAMATGASWKADTGRDAQRRPPSVLPPPHTHTTSKHCHCHFQCGLELPLTPALACTSMSPLPFLSIDWKAALVSSTVMGQQRSLSISPNSSSSMLPEPSTS